MSQQQNQGRQNQQSNGRNAGALVDQRDRGIVSSDGRQLMPSEAQWRQIKEMGAAAFKSGLLPQTIKNAEAAAIVALKSVELGLPVMEGFAHIHVINGKPSMSAELMHAQVLRKIPQAKINTLKWTNEICEMSAQRAGHIPITVSFSIDDARKAGLLVKDVWKNYPKAMLHARVMSMICRAYFPDALSGVSHTPEELGGDPGEVIETTGHHVEEPAPAVEATQPEPAKPTIEQHLVDLLAKLKEKNWPVTDFRMKAYLKHFFQKDSFKLLEPDQCKLMISVADSVSFDQAFSEISQQPLEQGSFDPNFADGT